MKFGLFWQVPGHEGSTVARRHIETIQEITLGDELGFHEAWLAESPFYPTRPMSQPLIVAAAAAQHTKNIRFGTLATQIPLHHPLDFATSAATTDIVTDGRLDLCLGGRYGGASSQVMGVSADIDQNTSREMVAEFADILQKAWGTERLSYRGKFWQIEDVPVVPLPVQDPHPPLLLAANSDTSFTFAGSEGLGVIGTTFSQPIHNLEKHAIAFTSSTTSAKSSQNPQPFHIAISLFVAETREKAHGLMSRNWRDSDVIADGPPVHSSAIGGGRHDFSSGAGGWGTWNFDEACIHSIYDDPEGCIKRLKMIEKKIPSLGQCILEFNRRGRLTTEEVQRSMRLFADQVMPEFSSQSLK